MATADVKQALERRQEAEPRKDVRALVERMAPELEKQLPKAITVERFTRVVLTELERTPKLYECEPRSLLGAMMLASQLGLEPGPLGHVYFVPFAGRAVFVLGYQGMIALAFRSGLLKDIEARTVREGDHFEYRHGTSPRLIFEPGPERDAPCAYYALARFRTGGFHFEVLTPEEIEAHRKRSPAGRASEGPWASDYERMAQKTCIRVMRPYLPLGVEAARAFAADEMAVPSDALDGDIIDAMEEAGGADE